MTRRPTDPAHFEAMYARDADPWRFASSDYERAKYAATLAALRERRFARGVEVGCSIGVLSRQLAGRCEAFLGLDVVQAAVDAARVRCADVPHARFEQATVPEDWPAGVFDLIVFSEVLYYLGSEGLARTAEAVVAGLAPGGVVVLVNWLGDTGSGVTGNAAAEEFITACRLRVLEAMRTGQYRIDVLG